MTREHGGLGVEAGAKEADLKVFLANSGTEANEGEYWGGVKVATGSRTDHVRRSLARWARSRPQVRTQVLHDHGQQGARREERTYRAPAYTEAFLLPLILL